MSICSEFEHLLEKMMADEIAPAETEQLRDHARKCDHCGSLLKLQEDLSAAGQMETELPSEDLQGVRYAVLRSIHLRSLPSTISTGRAGRTRVGLARLIWAAGLAAAVFVGGFFLGNFWSTSHGDPGSALIRQVYNDARKEKSLREVENSPLMYSNVSFSRVDDQKLSLSFDVARHVDLTAGPEDPLVRDLLIQALLNPSPLGARLKAISFAETNRDPEVKRALILSMLNDPSVAVRLKTESNLLNYKNDSEVQAAFLQVLRKEESVQLRLVALDYLVGNNVSQETLRAVVRDLRSQGETAVLRKAVAYLH
ncbi:MAG: zf-HC2 domain-containing protein [Acidobacteriia bacterium]|nr:zf-HC2 domain-containing protein [Terriglobia bacterium]